MLRFTIITLFIVCHTFAGGAFDDRYPSPRAMGMSNSVVAVTNDVWSSYYNPAGLSYVDNYQTGISYQKPFGYSFLQSIFASAAMPISPEYGSVGLSVESFGVKYKGNTMNQEYVAMLSHGFFLLNDIHTSLSIGYNLKYYHMSLGESVDGLDLGSGGTFGLDLGVQASIYKRTYLGLYVFNLNSPKLGVDTAGDLPRRVVIGAAYRPYTGLTTAISMNKALGFDTQFEGGFEFALLEMLDIRFGASTNPNRFTAGLGIEFESFQFDYGFRSHPVLTETHTFGFMYSW
ncbi:MAG: hypothetical protein D8M58_09940 [Calditrichaeota bacterium]|nr:MAG: hypothetical protein DWQ03_09315 [Calditrichota bacterium]MBL1205709.1 hypothetical protein [Calditrichota bacterium]NOG45537.1 hypothetical protein [Calditrichota bacterium]